jgi:hypothetical protein
MTILKSILLAGLACCLLSSLAFANNIPITGTATVGFAETLGDFNIQGPGLSLMQGLPDGPSFIGRCNIGSVCNFSTSINASGADFCTYCLYYDSGSLGKVQAQFLSPSLTFTGSAIYSGQSTMTVPMTVSGTIVAYQLLNCDDGVGCTLGPQVFSVKVTGTGIATFTMNPDGYDNIIGMSINFTGMATTSVPEPISLVLVGSGLAGILVRKKLGRGV